MPEDAAFSLCLTHDVDRPSKELHQGLYFAARERSLQHVRSALADEDPYWQFEDVTALEDDLGVRSAFYFLNEPHLRSTRPREWLDPTNLIEHLGRYDLTAPEIAPEIRRLDAGGWEVGLHGSRAAATDVERLALEKRVLESVLGHEVRGGRHHHLRLERPETWRRHATVGLRYDSSLGSGTECGFQHGYEPLRPFDDAFVVFPLTIMEQALPDPGRDFDEAWEECDALLEEAAANGATMTALWHPRYFNEEEFPGYRRLYRRLVERADELGAWIGTPAERYTQLQKAYGNEFSDESSHETPSAASSSNE